MKSTGLENAVTQLLNLAENALQGRETPNRFCGLKTPRTHFEEVLQKLSKNNEIYTIKSKHPELPIILSLEGGTGTGKSTIFNVLAGREVSVSGSERPKTFGPIFFCHKKHKDIISMPNVLSAYEKEFIESIEKIPAICGDPLKIKVILHGDKNLENIFLVDTPDIDSVETLNREMAEDVYNISDIILFITSQEKYGDRLPFQIFQQALADEKYFLIIMNKVDSTDAFTELKQRILSETKSHLEETSFFSLPWTISESPFEELLHHHELQRLKTILYDQSKELPGEIRKKELSSLKKRLIRYSEQLVSILEKERLAIDELLDNFQAIYDETEKQLLKKSVGHLDETTKQHIQNEIRQIFQRYDLLRKPRSFISKIIKFPLSLFGLIPKSDEEKRKRDLAKLHRKIDLGPLHLAINDLNRKIHNEIRITGIEYLQDMFLSRNLSMTVEEIDKLFFEKQKQLENWLQEQFSKLTKGIPKHKEWGIYSTTILWSIFLVSIETVVGGGLSMFEAILDSVIMPFLSKGAVEIFAYQELKNIAEELDKRYKKQLKEVLYTQYRRYTEALEACAITKSDLDQVKKLLGEIRS